MPKSNLSKNHLVSAKVAHIMCADVNSNRYLRQTLLPEIGEQGQALLQRARVLIVGAGGLGSPVALYLSAAGVGHIGLIDPDRVDESNLQRQVLFTSSDIGQLKVDAAKRRLLDLNPFVSIETFPVRLEAANAIDILRMFDVIIDGTDNFSAKFLINDAAVKLGVPVVYGSISRFEGHVSVFWAKKGACYRCLHKEPPKTEIQNCAEAGVLGAVAGIIGTCQAMEAMKLILKDHNPNFSPLIGRLLLLDANTLSFTDYRIPKNPDCPVCSRNPSTISLIDHEASCAVEVQNIDLSFDDFHALNPDSYHLLDVRETSEWNRGRIPGAIHWPLSKLQAGELPSVDVLQDGILYCQGGIRSKKAIVLLRAKGHHGLKHLKQGFIGWTGPIVR